MPSSFSTTPSRPTDYTTWSHPSLIARISHLESLLRAQTLAHASSSPPTKLKLKPKKHPKPFSPAKYHTRLIALKFAYLGAKYNGFEHHSNNATPLPTIEEELWKALMKTRLIFPTRRAGHEGREGEGDEVCWDGVDYSKCGRTDRGVSAFGQVVGLRVRSSRPKEAEKKKETIIVEGQDSPMPDGRSGGEGLATEGEEREDDEKEHMPAWDSVRDELPYIQLLNRVLPPDIRVLAWCPNPPDAFSARFNCKERRYRYFFTNPAYTPLPATRTTRSGEGWLDIGAMNEAAQKYEGLHDFRNLCKVDPSKQLTNFERRIFHAGIHEVQPRSATHEDGSSSSPTLYYFEVCGSAFLWHQVRHLVAVLFLVGQGHEKPSIVDDLLDIQKTPARPVYDMASDTPLVLWDCVFPDPKTLGAGDQTNSAAASKTGYEDGLNWIYVGQEVGGRDRAKRSTTAVEDGKFGRNGIMDELWALWRKRKMDEVLAWSLMEVVSSQGGPLASAQSGPVVGEETGARVFDGSETPRSVGTYVPILQREKLDTPDVVNARYALRKGLNGVVKAEQDADMDE